MKKAFRMILVVFLVMMVVSVNGIALSESELQNGNTYEILGNDKTGYMKAPGRWNNFYTLGDTTEQRAQSYELYGQEQKISSDYNGMIVTYYGFDVQQMNSITNETDSIRALEDLMENVLYNQYGAYDEPNYQIETAFRNEDGSAEALYFVFDEAEEAAYTPMVTYMYVSGEGAGHVWVFENAAGMGEVITSMIGSFSLIRHEPVGPKGSDSGIEVVLGQEDIYEILGNEKAGYMKTEGAWRSCHINGTPKEQLDEVYELYGQESWFGINNNLIVTCSGYTSQQLDSITSASERDQRMIELGDYALLKIFASFDEPKTAVHGAYRNPDGSVEMLVSVYDDAGEASLTFIYVHIANDDRGYVWMFENIYDESAVYLITDMMDSFSTSPTVADEMLMPATALSTTGMDKRPDYPIEQADSFEYQIEKDQTVTIKKYKGTNPQFTIPNRIDGLPVTKIDHSFGSDVIESVVIPEGVERIESNAFYYCDNLKNVWIPSTVTEIGTPLVQKCPLFEQCEVSEDNPVYYVEQGVLFRQTYQYAHGDENGIVLVCYPPNKKDTQYSVPDGVVYIEHGAFSDARNLNFVKLPESVSRIFMLAFYSSGIIEIELPSHVEQLQEGTFANCKNLKRVVFPKGLVYFGPGVFSECDSLCEFVVEPGNPVLYAEDNVLFLRENITVYDYTNPKAPMGWYRRDADGPAILCYPAGLEAETYEIPKNIKTIMDDAFAGSKLKHVYIPSNVNTIGHDAFFACKSLEDVVFENGIKYLGDSVFQMCSNLSSIVLPDSLEYIGMYTFASTSLKEIVIPESVTDIGTYAFLYNSGLTLSVKEGSYAEEFAKKNKYNHTIRQASRADTSRSSASGPEYGKQLLTSEDEVTRFALTLAGMPEDQIDEIISSQPRKGDRSDRIYEIKLRLQELGYYRSSASMDNEFNDIMEERLKMFQKNNGLDVTGTFNYLTEITLFTGLNIVRGQWK